MEKHKKLIETEIWVGNPSSGPDSFTAALDLPATDYEIRDAVQQARGCNVKEENIDISVLSCDELPILENIRLILPQIRELNFFAKRLEELHESEKIVLQALLQQRYQNGEYEYGISMKELINLTYGLESVLITSNIRNDTELGSFVIEDGMNDDISRIPQTAIYLLNKSKIGEMQRKIDGGVYISNYYIITGTYEDQEVYDGKNLPEAPENTSWVFRLQIDGRNKEVSTIAFPTGFEEAEKINGKLSGQQAVIREYDSIIPQIDIDFIDQPFHLYTLNQLAYRIRNMSEQEQIKFKAVLETENIQNLDTALDVADHISEYALDYYSFDEDDFMKSYLTHHLPANFDPHWLKDIACDTAGSKLVKKLNANASSYGIISARGQSLYQIIPYHDNLLEQNRNTTLNSTGDGMESNECKDIYGRMQL